tara:strand:+ start:383 stop:1168 length:786 start_codon:yes stop_codon:yes gene_type:complete
LLRTFFLYCLVFILFSFPSFGSALELDEETKKLIDTLAHLNRSTGYPNPTAYAYARGSLMTQISARLCPPEALPVFTSFCPETPLDLESFDIPENNILGLDYLFKEGLLSDEVEIVRHELGRLLVVGFKNDQRAYEYLAPCGSEGLRTLFFALRDTGRPHKFREYMKFYNPHESSTCNIFLSKSLVPYIYPETPEGKDLFASCPPEIQKNITVALERLKAKEKRFQNTRKHLDTRAPPSGDDSIEILIETDSLKGDDDLAD